MFYTVKIATILYFADFVSHTLQPTMSLSRFAAVLRTGRGLLQAGRHLEHLTGQRSSQLRCMAQWSKVTSVTGAAPTFSTKAATADKEGRLI